MIATWVFVLALAVTAVVFASCGLILGCLLAARSTDDDIADARYERDINQALLIASEADQRTRAMKAHPAGGRNAKAWAALVGDTTAVTRIGRW